MAGLGKVGELSGRASGKHEANMLSTENMASRSNATKFVFDLTSEHVLEVETCKRK